VNEPFEHDVLQMNVRFGRAVSLELTVRHLPKPRLRTLKCCKIQFT
jgi:hypothetical protein